MTQQGKRQARFRQWANTELTYNGDVIAAGQAASGKTGLNYNEALIYALQAISGSQSKNLLDLQSTVAELLSVPGGFDSVGDELPFSAWGFQSGGAFPALTYVNAVTGTTQRDNLDFRAAGTARTSELGLLSEAQSTNKCTGTNIVPTDTTGTNPSPQFTTNKFVPRDQLPTEVLEGLAAVNPPSSTRQVTGMFLSISNAAGNIIMDGVTGTAATHTAYVFQYVVSGTAGPGITGQGGNLAGPEGFVRKEFSALTGTTDQMAMTTGGAAEFYWIAYGLEQKPTRSSTIEVSGATATRPGDLVYGPTPARLDVNAWTAVVRFNKYADVGTNDRVLQVGDGTDGANTFIGTRISTTTLLHQIFDGGTVAENGPSYTPGADATQAFGIDGTDIEWAVNGTKIGTYPTIVPGQYPRVYFGCRPAGQQENGYIQSVVLFDAPPTDPPLAKLSE